MSRAPILLTLTVLAVTAGCDPSRDPVKAARPDDPEPVTLQTGDLTARVRPTGARAPLASAGVPTRRAGAETLEPAAAGDVVYDAVPSPLPGSLPSMGFQGPQADEWGDHVMLTQGGPLGGVAVGLVSWACENDPVRAPADACVTTPGTSFSHPITLNLYEVDLSGAVPAVGALLASRTQTFDIPFRPSWNGTYCLPPAYNAPYGGQWYDPVAGQCVDGFATVVQFDFSGAGVELPSQVIYGVAFNTQNAGAAPMGVPGPWDKLAVGVANTWSSPPPSVGADAEADYTFLDAGLAGWYCDGGAAGVDVFRRDGCWGGYTPAVRFTLGAAQEPVAAGSVTGTGLWRDAGAGRRGGPPARLTVAAGYRGGAATLQGQVDLTVPWAGLRLRSRTLSGLTVAGAGAVLEGEGEVGGEAVTFVLTLEAGAGPGGEDTLEVVIRSAAAPDDIVFETGGAVALGGGSFQIG